MGLCHALPNLRRAHPWLHDYTTARPHSALKGLPPLSPVNRNDVLGNGTWPSADAYCPAELGAAPECDQVFGSSAALWRTIRGAIGMFCGGLMDDLVPPGWTGRSPPQGGVGFGTRRGRAKA
jgi:hypothetical protein